MGARTVIRSVVASAAAAIVLVSAAGVPQAAADPATIDDAKAQVEELQKQAGEIGEDYDEAQIQLADGKERLKVLRADISAQQVTVEALTQQARQITLMQFQNRGADTTIEVFTDSDPDTFLHRLATASKVDENLNATLQSQRAEQDNLTDLQRAAEAETAALATKTQQLAELDTQIKDKVAKADALVASLTEAQRQQLEARSGLRVSFDVTELDSSEAVNARALDAVKYAVSKVPGGQYVWGASGPSNFDCSGLMLAAYRSVGVSLPHSSRAQASLGRPVSRDELKPGDLIFWYHPIHHVGMYIGGGKIVHARNVSSDLVVQTLASYPAPWAGARRILG
ncbi:MAG: C40 family peptidase [Propionibacteriaceae bacterium]|nr:C40 family peptidase [Propionibacteriaceae bacterium]